MGPFTFNGIRFSLGALALVPFLLWQRKKEANRGNLNSKAHFWPIVLTGVALFAGSSLQQIGLVGTTAGKAGFITGLYMIIVPFLALLRGERTHLAHWIGAILAVIGLFLLSVHSGWSVSSYDLIVLTGAFAWAIHVHLVAKNAERVGVFQLAIWQFAICGVLSLAVALVTEPVTLLAIYDGKWAILYGSFLSVGLAYTLQVVAQKTADPTHAVVIMSLEGAFAALGGWLLLNEGLGLRGLIGAGLMLLGTLISQFFNQPQTEINKPGSIV